MTRQKNTRAPAGMTLTEFGAEVIAQRIAGMARHADGVRAGDVEALHDMRVASRRLRAALVIFEPAFPDPAYADLEREVKGITRALGEARDLDVMGERLEALAASLAPEEAAGVRDLAARTARRRTQRQEGVDTALDRLAARDLAGLFSGIVTRITDRRRWLAEGAAQVGAPTPALETQNGAR